MMSFYNDWVHQEAASRHTGGFIPHPIHGVMSGGPFRSPMDVALHGNPASSYASSGGYTSLGGSSSGGSSDAGSTLGALAAFVVIGALIFGASGKAINGNQSQSSLPVSRHKIEKPTIPNRGPLVIPPNSNQYGGSRNTVAPETLHSDTIQYDRPTIVYPNPNRYSGAYNRAASPSMQTTLPSDTAQYGAPVAADAFVTARALSVRTLPKEKAPQIEKIACGSTVHIERASAAWSEVTYVLDDGSERRRMGYVKTEYLSGTPPNCALK